MPLVLEVSMNKYKFMSFDSDDFYEAIESKKYAKLKNCVISAIRNNPGFNPVMGKNAAEATIAMRILDEKIPDIFEKYEMQEGDQLYNESYVGKWDKEFFIRQTFLLRENFSKKRYNQIISIGKYISRGIIPNFQEPQELNLELFDEQEIKPIVQQTSKKMNPLLIAGVIILAIIVLVVIGIK